MSIMDLSALWTFQFLHGNGLVCMRAMSCLYGQHADLHAAVVACIAHESEWTLQDHTFMAQTFVMLETSGI